MSKRKYPVLAPGTKVTLKMATGNKTGVVHSHNGEYYANVLRDPDGQLVRWVAPSLIVEEPDPEYTLMVAVVKVGTTQIVDLHPAEIKNMKSLEQAQLAARLMAGTI